MIEMPPKLWLPPKPAIIRAASMRDVEDATIQMGVGFHGQRTPVTHTYEGNYTTNNNTTAGTTMSQNVAFGPARADRALALVFVYLESSGLQKAVSAVSIGGVAAVIAANTFAFTTLEPCVGVCIAVARVPTGTSGLYSVTFASSGVDQIRATVYNIFNLISVTPTAVSSDQVTASSGSSSSKLDLDLTMPGDGVVIAQMAHVRNPASGAQSWSGPLTARETVNFSNFYYSNASRLTGQKTPLAISQDAIGPNGAYGGGVIAAYR